MDDMRKIFRRHASDIEGLDEPNVPFKMQSR